MKTAHSAAKRQAGRAGPRKELSLFDSTCIIGGVIIGAGIYETAPLVAKCMAGPGMTMAIWLIGGFLALTGALCYAELAGAYPHEGGDYIYLSRAYGKGVGFLFGWSQLAIVRPGDIALMSFVFGRYAENLYQPFANCRWLYAAAAVVALTAINIAGVRQGKWTQNILTVTKALGLGAIVAVAVFAEPAATTPSAAVETQSLTADGIKLALILVLFTFGGWNEMAYVAAEVKNPNRNITRALVVGTVTVTILYLLVNGAFLRVLGYPKMAGSQAVAAETVAAVLPASASRLISALICISALGAANGLIFTGARISYALGAEYRAFGLLGRWHPRLGTPVWALLLQGLISAAIVLFAGSFVETILYSAPVVWLFFLGTAGTVFVLRAKEPHVARPYRVTGHPATTALFCLCCAFMFYSCVSYALAQRPIGLVIAAVVLAAGVVLYRLTGRSGRPGTAGSNR